MDPLEVPCPACHSPIGTPCAAVKRSKKTVKVPASGHHIVRASKAAAVTSGRAKPSTAKVTRTNPPRGMRGQGRALSSTSTMLSKSQRVVLGGRLRALSYATYSDYLRGAHWQHFSTMVATPYRNCHVCGKSGSNLHHPDYSTLGRERPDDVVPLCDEHHEIVHRVHVAERRPLASCHIVVRQRHEAGLMLIQPVVRGARSPAA